MAVQVANALRRRLRQEYADGGRLPSEHDMAAELGVSRGTVRQALTILQQEGAVSRQQGAGTFANPNVLGIQARVDFAYEFGQLIEAAGYKASIQTLEVRPDAASAAVAQRLDLAPGTPVLVLHKLFLASGQPAIFVIEHLPTSLIREPYQAAELEEPLFQFLERRCHAPVDYILSEIMPSQAGDGVPELLNVAPGSPLLKFVEVFYSRKNAPLGLATIYFRDPLIRFHALRKVSQLA
jgi:GntR family transcriptional regulator